MSFPRNSMAYPSYPVVNCTAAINRPIPSVSFTPHGPQGMTTTMMKKPTGNKRKAEQGDLKSEMWKTKTWDCYGNNVKIFTLDEENLTDEVDSGGYFRDPSGEQYSQWGMLDAEQGAMEVEMVNVGVEGPERKPKAQAVRRLTKTNVGMDENGNAGSVGASFSNPHPQL